MIIGIAGKARSGKDQFADYLVEVFEKVHDKFFMKAAFATSLKYMCMESFDLSPSQVYRDKKEVPDLRYPKDGVGVSSNPSDYWTPREIMQALGSFYRSIDYDFWVKQTDKEIKSLSSRVDEDGFRISGFIITDVRHVNECEYVKKNGILIKVIRPDADEIHGMDHESETALDNKPADYFDITVENSGTLKDLLETAHEVAGAAIAMNAIRNQGRVVENE